MLNTLVLVNFIKVFQASIQWQSLHIAVFAFVPDFSHQNQRVKSQNIRWEKYSVLVQIVEQDFEIESRIVVRNLGSKMRFVQVQIEIETWFGMNVDRNKRMNKRRFRRSFGKNLFLTKNSKIKSTSTVFTTLVDRWPYIFSVQIHTQWNLQIIFGELLFSFKLS